MTSSFLRLNLSDLAKGLVVAVIAAVVTGFQQGLTEHALDFAAYDWGSILNMAITCAVAYLGKNLLSDSDGKVLGKIG